MGTPSLVKYVARHVDVKYILDDTRGAICIFIFYKGRLQAYLELQPTDFEEVHRFFFFGFTIDGKPFMEAGHAEGDYDVTYDPPPKDDFAEMLVRGTYSCIPWPRKVYRVRPETIRRKLAEVMKLLEKHNTVYQLYEVKQEA